MNICIFGSNFLPEVGGKEYVMHHLGNALVEIGHEVVIVAKRVTWHASREKRGYELKRYSVPIKGSGKIGLDFCMAMLTVTLQNSKRKIDILNCHGVDDAGNRARALKHIHGFPLVMTPHGMDVQKKPEIGYGLRLNHKWDRRITKNLQAADYVTAISQSVHNDLDMVQEERIVNIPNGIHIKRFVGPKSGYLREHFGISNTCKIILSVGRNHIKKGYDYGIQAVSEVVKKLDYKNVHYVIVGRGVTAHQKIVAKCQAETFVSLVDEVPPGKITQCYKSADIFFSPSIVEGLSLVSLEAMAAELPLVVTNVPGNDDVVKENGCGVIVKSKDVGDMARGLHQFLKDDSFRSSLTALSKQCSSKYDWAHIAKQYEKVYEQAIWDNNKEKTRSN